jgi:hypothetical protein
MRLGVGEILGESFAFFFARLGLFFHLVTIPWIVSVLLRVFFSAATEHDLIVVLAEKAIDVIPTTMFMVAWMRLVLLGPERVERLPGTGWSRRETAFLVHLIQVGGITFALIVAFTLTLGTIDPATLGKGSTDPDLMRREAMAAPLGTGFVVSAVLALRVSFGLAASAVDVPWSPRRSWTWGRGNAWPIIASLFLIMLAGAVATSMAVLLPLSVLRNLGADSAAAIVTWTIAILVSYGGAAVVATAQAIIFRRLTQWRDGIPVP